MMQVLYSIIWKHPEWHLDSDERCLQKQWQSDCIHWNLVVKRAHAGTFLQHLLMQQASSRSAVPCMLISRAHHQAPAQLAGPRSPSEAGEGGLS